MKDYEKKVALITGGAGSVNQSNSTQVCWMKGASVMLLNLGKDALQQTVDELGSKNVAFIVADVIALMWNDMQKEAVAKFGKVDPSNAGIEGGKAHYRIS